VPVLGEVPVGIEPIPVSLGTITPRRVDTGRGRPPSAGRMSPEVRAAGGLYCERPHEADRPAPAHRKAASNDVAAMEVNQCPRR
jgi:hypothetical protein